MCKNNCECKCACVLGELEEGKSYRTRGGWRAIALQKTAEGRMSVWHSNTRTVTGHYINGPLSALQTSPGDVMEEWKEPRVICGYSAVYENPHDTARPQLSSMMHLTKSSARKAGINWENSTCRGLRHGKLLGVVKIEFVEGEGL